MTTYAIIKQKFLETIQKRHERKIELRKVAEKLVQKYKESLSLPSEGWLDAGGIPRTYVSIGIRNPNDLYQPTSFSSLETDENYVLNFIISTALNEFENGDIEYAEVVISIHKEAASYYVVVGNEKRSFREVNVNAADAFENICEAIKKSVLSSFADKRLDY